jgi:hypothetical protein
MKVMPNYTAKVRNIFLIAAKNRNLFDMQKIKMLINLDNSKKVLNFAPLLDRTLPCE